MKLDAIAGTIADRLPLPDALLRAAIAGRVAATSRQLASPQGDPAEAEARFLADMRSRPIAVATEAANTQHYELPPEFFALVLGPRRKYSSCLYQPGDTLPRAEDRALIQTCANADLQDGQHILELGCGWGSLSLWMAERYPAARITAVSNSSPQRAYILAQAAALGLSNLRVITADMNHFQPDATFDRIVSVEMFEHMANWHTLLGRVRTWLRPGGKLFLHVFSHRAVPYRFNSDDPAEWIAQHFFTGGIMPSHTLPARFPDLFTVEASWRWPGTHYAQTARHWLANYTTRSAEIAPILNRVYGAQTPIWTRRWRLFFLATEGLFGHAGGAEWGVSHYRMVPGS